MPTRNETVFIVLFVILFILVLWALISSYSSSNNDGSTGAVGPRGPSGADGTNADIDTEWKEITANFTTNVSAPYPKFYIQNNALTVVGILTLAVNLVPGANAIAAGALDFALQGDTDISIFNENRLGVGALKFITTAGVTSFQIFAAGPGADTWQVNDRLFSTSISAIIPRATP